MLRTIEILPQNARVGLISFGKLIYVHELKLSECPRNFVFNGLKTYDIQKLKACLSLGTQQYPEQNDFILPVEEAKAMLLSIIDNVLEVDPFHSSKENRFERCTGAALDMAITLLQALFPNSSSQIILFTGGPITRGPGRMAELKRTQLVRQNQDIEQDKLELVRESRNFFNGISKRASSANIVVNYIAASFEESGIYEISKVILETGGFLLANESFTEENIYKTLEKYFTGGIFENAGSDATMTINIPSFIKITNSIGPCSKVGENSVESIYQSRFKACGIIPSTTFSFYFEIVNTKANPVRVDQVSYIQITTKYKRIFDGSSRVRVTTIPITFADLTTNKERIIQAFDQEAGAVLFSKQFIFNAIDKLAEDQKYTIDKMLIQFCKTFGSFRPKDPSSFLLPANMQFLPHFIFHLKRSPFLNIFNSTPDQTASLRHALISEDTSNSLFMVEPTLMQYSLDQLPTPVILDTSSLRPDIVLLLDTYFRVLIWHGSTIAAWRKQGYQEQEEYQNLKAALEQPVEEAKAIINERFPCPQFISCDQDSSAARYLLARCNPSKDSSYTSAFSSDNLNTDEQSLAGFSQMLKEKVVNS